MRCWMRRLGARLAVLAVLASVSAVQPAGAHDAQVPDTAGLGVLITDSGLVLPVREVRDRGYLVGTPCGWEAEAASGLHVAAADVVIDPGHGGNESGAVGANGLAEKDLNLAVAELARDELEARGYRTVLTRTTDVRMPTVVRGEIALALSAEVFVSIHHNGGATRRSPDPGTEVFHQSRSAQSRRLAGLLFEEVQSALSQFDVAWVASLNKGTKAFERERDRKDLFGVLRHPVGIPSALLEAAYLTNPPEARLLADPTVQAVEARAVADGIVRYLTTDDPGSGHKGTTVTDRILTTGGQHDCKDGVLDVNAGPGFRGVFRDDDGSVHESAIDYLAQRGITSGCDAARSHFCPSDSITRAQMAVLLVRALGERPSGSSSSRFSDVADDAWYRRHVERFAELGVTSGFNDGTFRPDQPVTRAQMALFLARAFDLPAPSVRGVIFVDVDASSAAAPAIETVQLAGIAQGCAASPARYCPDRTLLRDEMAAFLHRALLASRN